MYVVGSKVVHPCHGAGTIVRIQQKSIGDLQHTYYVIDTVGKAMQIMVPVRRADSMGLRDVGDQAELRDTLACCGEAPDVGEIESDFRTRQSALHEQLKSGEFSMVSQAVRTLYFLNAQRPLGMLDRQMFDSGKQILASELALASNQDLQAALDEVESTLAKMLAVEDEE
jgi:CarD family transcriptional regulator